MSRIVDLTHPIQEGMPSYPGFPPPRIGAFWTHEESRPHYQNLAEFFISRYEMTGSTGTYMDSPFHRHRNGIDLSGIPIEHVADLPSLVIDARSRAGRALEAGLIGGVDVAGRGVLFRTGWSERWGTDSYWEPGPFLSTPLCDLLVAGGVHLVGVDFWNVDDTGDPSRPAHTTLLGANVLIVENLANLAALPESFRLHAAPLPIAGGAAVPVRAYAVAKV